jgi:hypothetical protein
LHSFYPNLIKAKEYHRLVSLFDLVFMIFCNRPGAGKWHCRRHNMAHRIALM